MPKAKTDTRATTNVLALLALVANTRQLYADAPDRAPYLDAIQAARAGRVGPVRP